MKITFHKKNTVGAGHNGQTVNAAWYDVAVDGQKAGYIFKSVGGTFWEATVSLGMISMAQFLSLKVAKQFMRETLEAK